MEHNLDTRLKQVIESSSSLRDKLIALSDLVLELLQDLYKCEDVEQLVRAYLQDVVRSRELVLALYLPVALLLKMHPELARALPDEIVHHYLSMLLVLYEKSKHIYTMLRQGR